MLFGNRLIFQDVLSFVLQLLGLDELCFQDVLSFVDFFIIRTDCRSLTDCRARPSLGDLAQGQIASPGFS